MIERKWGTPESLKELLLEVVSWKSMTLTEGERQFPVKLKKKLEAVPYFQENSDYLALHEADLGRKFLTALYKHPEARETICLISHFDTVNTEEYGDLEPLATQPEKITKALHDRKNELPQDAREDLESGEYLFGRGTMDMKMGLVLHMSLIEKASVEKWPINLLLLTVPDEEVNSSGMRCAVETLITLQQNYNLTYKLFLNSEPVFTEESNQHYLYTGTIGKMLPAALIYGKETHAGKPLSGLTSPYITSYLTQEMEFNDLFQEISYSETSPLPVTLQQKDLKMEYSTQTPYRSAALYNIFLMERNANEVFHLFEQVAETAAKKCNVDYQQICQKQQMNPIGEVKVIRYKDLLDYAIRKFGVEFIEQIKEDVHAHEEWDDREKSLRITDRLMIECQELGPAIVVLLAPPYYPAVNSTGNELIEACTDFVSKTAAEKFGLSIERKHYFNGLCDLSYVNDSGSSQGWTSFEENTPVWGDSYTIPFESMKQLNAPVLNVGPLGKDAHKRTERLHMRNAFEEVPVILEEMIGMIAEIYGKDMVKVR